MNTITVKRAFQYRIYPNVGQVDKLTWTLDRCRELYNAALEERREAYRMCGLSVSYYDQKRQLPAIKEVRPEYKEPVSVAAKPAVGIDMGLEDYATLSNGEHIENPRYYRVRPRRRLPAGSGAGL